MAKLTDFKNLYEVEAWVAERMGVDNALEEHSLILECVDLLRKFGYDKPKSPLMRSIKNDGQAFVTDVAQVKPVIPIRGWQVGTCGIVLGAMGLRCNLPINHEGTHNYSRDRNHIAKVETRAHTHAVEPLFREADPELERLLAEEREIMRKTRGDPEAMDPDRYRHFAEIRHEVDELRHAQLQHILGECGHDIGYNGCNLAVGHPGGHAFTATNGFDTAAVIDQIPPMVPGAPPLAPALGGKTVLPEMGAPKLPAMPLGIYPHGTVGRYDQGCLCGPCLDAHYHAEENEEDEDYYDEPEEEFDD